MFNSTHTLVGLAIARTGAGRWVRYGTATAVIAANLPDIDIITSFWGTAAYLDHHRGITHSIVGVPFLSLLLACVMYFFSGNFGKTYAIALIAMATHPALDFLNSYGLRPFLPWSGKWYYGDALFIFDPLIDLALLVGILGWQSSNRKQIGAFISLGLATLYIGGKVYIHSMAMTTMNAWPRSAEIEKWAALPEIHPLHWNSILYGKTGAASTQLTVLIRARGFDDEIAQLKSSPPSEITERASSSRSAAILLQFARFPVTRVERLPSGYRVTFIDFSFYRETANICCTALGAEVILDDSLRVVEDDVAFVQKIN